MKTQIVYVLISTENDLYLEEFWASLFSLRQFHPTDRVIVLTDTATAKRVRKRPSLNALITEIKEVNVPETYDAVCRSREIKTSIRNLIDGDFLFIDTDTIITQSLEDIDSLHVDYIAMVPEQHDLFRNHITYEYTYRDVKRIFNVDVSDSTYWFNSGVIFVRDNQVTRDFYMTWHANWMHSTFKFKNRSDQRALISTDKHFGYIIKPLPDVYNCQIALSIQYFYDAKIIHFWHMRALFNSDLSFSPFFNKYVYKQIRIDGGISPKTSSAIILCKSSFSSPSMTIGKKEIGLLLSPFVSVLGNAYANSRSMHWFLDKIIYVTTLYYKTKKKIQKNFSRINDL